MSDVKFKASLQQSIFFDWTVQGSGSAVLSAVAGAGKTTTLVRALGLMTGRTFFGSFGADIVKEIKQRCIEMGLMRNGLDIRTMHSVGKNAWTNLYKNVKIDDGKTRIIIKAEMLKNSEYVKFASQTGFICKLVDFGKSHLMGIKAKIDNKVIWEKLMRHYSLDYSLPETEMNPETNLPKIDPRTGMHVPFDLDGLLDFVIKVFKISIEMGKVMIDFSDMLYLPLYYSVRLPTYAWVVIDEGQDLNVARREMARRMLAPNGRLVCVGDERQSIFGFTGAGVDSMSIIQKEFNATKLNLSVTYRCPKAVVAYVRQWVSHIEAAPEAPEGIVRRINTSEKENPWFIKDGIGANDAVLCRYTSPLVANAFEFLRKGIPCKVEGRDIGKNLIAQINRWSSIKTLDALEKKLESNLEAEIIKADENEDETRKNAAQDMFDTIMIFVDKTREKRLNTVAALIEEIESLFEDKVSGVLTLCTIHKAKGREWHKVYWLETMLRGQRELKDWEKTQEENLNYVAGTRAKNELVLVSENIHSPEKKK